MVNLSLTKPMQAWCQIAMAPETWAGSRKNKPTVSRPPVFSFFKNFHQAQRPLRSRYFRMAAKYRLQLCW